ncbi:host nuclease inhibitor GamL [Pantoea dispersa]|uniref:host nuclease inhibitor GamL n=1 Tax=Pantoea dispersa TaxID=59814 RepID=UPI0028DFCFAC|nr:host nuclease inhibitor GamL [Pantoea dispersa]MDT8849383.1 host nuclease inhibitor GamL [Pantoea dispersa]
MMPFIQLEHRRQELSEEEQQIIKKEQWIDDETARLLQRFPPYLSGFRHWRQDAEVKACCEQADAEEAYQYFIWQLAYGQAQRNYPPLSDVELSTSRACRPGVSSGLAGQMPRAR